MRKKSGEDGAAGAGTDAASDADGAPVASDDALGDPQSESVADVLLGSEEGVEDFGDGFLGDSGAGVGQSYYGAGALVPAHGRGGPDSYRESAVPGCGVDGVGDLVGEDLAELSFETPDFEFATVLPSKGEALGLDLATVEEEKLVENGGEADDAGRCALAVEAEGVFGDLRNSGELFVSDLEVLGDVLAGGGAGEIDGVGDGLERIIDLMRDAGGETSCRGEFFGVAKGLFGAPAAGCFRFGGAGPLLEHRDGAEAILFARECGVILCRDNVGVFGAQLMEGLGVFYAIEALHGIGAVEMEGVSAREIVPKSFEFQCCIEVSF